MHPSSSLPYPQGERGPSGDVPFPQVGSSAAYLLHDLSVEALMYAAEAYAKATKAAYLNSASLDTAREAAVISTVDPKVFIDQADRAEMLSAEWTGAYAQGGFTAVTYPVVLAHSSQDDQTSVAQESLALKAKPARPTKKRDPTVNKKPYAPRPAQPAPAAPNHPLPVVSASRAQACGGKAQAVEKKKARKPKASTSKVPLLVNEGPAVHISGVAATSQHPGPSTAPPALSLSGSSSPSSSSYLRTPSASISPPNVTGSLPASSSASSVQVQVANSHASAAYATTAAPSTFAHPYSTATNNNHYNQAFPRHAAPAPSVAPGPAYHTIPSYPAPGHAAFAIHPFQQISCDEQDQNEFLYKIATETNLLWYPRTIHWRKISIVCTTKPGAKAYSLGVTWDEMEIKEKKRDLARAIARFGWEVEARYLQ